MRYLLVLLTLLSVCVLPSESAEAGVLLRSSRVRSRTTVRPPRVHLGRTQKSTWIAARINPVSGRVRSYGTPDSLAKIERREQKYQKKYARWQRKAERTMEKAKRKKERQKRKEQQLEAKKRKAMLRKLEREKRKKSRAASEKGDAPAEKGEITKTGKGGVTLEQEERGQKRQSFWTRFWNALMGKTGKASDRQEAEDRERAERATSASAARAEPQRAASASGERGRLNRSTNAPQGQSKSISGAQSAQKAAPVRRKLFDTELGSGN